MSELPEKVVNPKTGRLVKVGGRAYKKMLADQTTQSVEFPVEKQIVRKTKNENAQESSPVPPVSEQLAQPPKIRKKAKAPVMKTPKKAPERPESNAPKRQGQTKLIKDGATFSNSTTQDYLQFGN